MHVYTTYKAKIKHYNHIFKDTVAVYRNAVDYLITVCNENWDAVTTFVGANKLTYMEKLIHTTKDNPHPVYDFDTKFYKLPSYLRRSAINEVIGKVSSYRSNLTNWENNPVGRKTSAPEAGYVYPAMYRTDMYKQISKYEAQLKVFIHNTWDWITVELRHSFYLGEKYHDKQIQV